MPLPSSGQLAFSAIRDEFYFGGCLEGGSDYSISSFAIAQDPAYSYGGIIYTSGFYGGACPAPNCYCYVLVLEALATYYEYRDCCGNYYSGNTSQTIRACCNADDPPFATSGTWLQEGSCVCGQVCGK